jgi:hypothetical protein
MSQNTLTQKLLNEADTARYIGFSRGFLRKARMEGNRQGRTPAPPAIRFGRTIRYAVEDLDAWIDAHRKGV